MAEMPGVMLYFEMRPCLKRLSNAEKGLLFDAIMDYSQAGIVPDFEGMLGIAWDFIQPRLDSDRAAYAQKVQQRQYAVYVREQKQRGEQPVPFEQWALYSDDEPQREASDDVESYPTTTTASTSTSTSTTATASSSTTEENSSSCRTAAAEPRRQPQRLIFLSQENLHEGIVPWADSS